MTLVWRPGFQFDADASTYIEAVEAADEAASPGIGALETGVRYAINDFVIGCKQDGIWSAIKASCILAGARTRQGALVPLRNEFDVVNNIQPAAPQAFNFLDGDYDRKTGLKGDGSTKYLDSNRNNNADPQNSKHISIRFTDTAPTSWIFAARGIGAVGNTTADIGAGGRYGLNGPSTSDAPGTPGINALFGMSRPSPSLMNVWLNDSSKSYSFTSTTPNPESLTLLARRNTSTGLPEAFSNARFSFYSIGESLDLGKLDARVTDLITAIGAAIP